MKKILMLTMCLVLVPMLFSAESDADAIAKQAYNPDARDARLALPPTGPVQINDGRALGDLLMTIDLAAIGVPGGGFSGAGLTWDGTYLYYENQNTHMIYVIDPTVPMVVTSWSAGLPHAWGVGSEANIWIDDALGVPGMTYEYTWGGTPTGNSFNAMSGGASWMGDISEWYTPGEIAILAVGGTNAIYTFTVPGGTPITSISDPVWAYISQRALTYDPFNHTFWLGGWNVGTIWEVDANTGAVLRQFNPADASIAGLAYDWQSTLHPTPVLWLATNATPDYIYMLDADNPQPAGGILYVDDDDDAALSGYFETALDNNGYAYDVWIVTDSGDVTPTEAVMSNYDVVIWTTGDDWSSTFVGNDTIEVANYFAGGGKMWLSSEDILYDLGFVSWLHVASYTSDVGCVAATGIGPIMTGTSFATTGGIVFDYSDDISPDAFAWTEMQNETPVDNTIAMDTTTGLSYFLFFNTFPFENIDDPADRDTMLVRVLSWMGLQPVHDVGTDAILEPVGTYNLNDVVTPRAQVRNFGDFDETFPVIFTMTLNATLVYADTVTMTLMIGAVDTAVFASYTLDQTGTYDIVSYTELVGDQNPANDTATAQATIYLVGTDYIVIDVDPTPLTGPWLHTMFQSWGFAGVYTTSPAFINADSLSIYETAWICLGIYSNWYDLTNAQATAIGDYLATGRNAYVEGGDSWGFGTSRTILCPLFGIDPNATFDGSADLFTVDGMANGQIPEVDGHNWTYTGENNYIDQLGLYASPPNGGTVEGFLWNSSVSYWTGAAYDQGTWKGVGLSHELAGDVAGTIPGDSLLWWIAEYLDLIVGITEEPGEANIAVFGFAPNMSTVTKQPIINYSTTTQGRECLKVYDNTGRLIRTLVDRPNEAAGTKSVYWNRKDDTGRTVANGVYFIRLESVNQYATHKLILIK